MKVVHVTLRFDAPGGVETNVREVTRRLVRTGVDAQVFASDLYDEARWERRTGYPPIVDGVPVRRFPVRKRLLPGLTLPMMPGLIDGLSASGADLFHAHSHRYGHVLQTSAVAKKREIPLIVSTHYHPADLRESDWKRGLLRLQDVGFGMTAYRTARALVVETQVEARLIREFAPGDRVHVIPPGVDLEPWKETEVGDVPELPPRYFLFAGRIAPNKGLPFLLDAFARLSPSDRIPLYLMGRDWGMRAQLESQSAQLRISSDVRFLEVPADPRMYRAIYRRATAFVLPSEWEAFGLVALDAMAAHTPVIATARGGLPEVLREGRAGRLVPYGNVNELASALTEASRGSPQVKERVSLASSVVQEYSWDRCVESHRTLYETLLNR